MQSFNINFVNSYQGENPCASVCKGKLLWSAGITHNLICDLLVWGKKLCCAQVYEALTN